MIYNESIRPKVFISYSWDDEDHKEWILQLANSLINNGVQVILDRYDLSTGSNLHLFMEKAVDEAEKVIIVFTPNYKLKCDNRLSGVGFEYSLITSEIYNNISNNLKFLPIIRRGDFAESIPTFMKSFVHLNFIDDKSFNNNLDVLVRNIYGVPVREKPQLGSIPKFNSNIQSGELHNDSHVKNKFIPYKRNNLWGYYNEDGKIVVDFIYDYVWPDCNNPNGLLCVTKNKRSGLIDKHGKVVVPIQYESIHHEFTYNVARVKMNSRYGYINPEGRLIIPCVYDDACSHIRNELAHVKCNKKSGYIACTGEMIIPFLYDDAKCLSGNLAPVKLKDKWGYINKNGDVVIDFQFYDADVFYDDLAWVRHGNMEGYLNIYGEVEIPFQYWNVGNFQSGRAYYRREYYKRRYSYGFIDKSGQVVIDFIYDAVQSFHNDLAAVKLKNKWGYIDPNGNIIIPTKYDVANSFINEFAYVSYGNKSGYINKYGQEFFD